METHNTDIYTHITKTIRQIINTDILSGHNVTEPQYLEHARGYALELYEKKNNSVKRRMSIWRKEFDKDFNLIWEDIWPEVLDFIQATVARGEKKGLKAIYAEMLKLGFKGGKVRISHCLSKEVADKLKELIIADYPSCDVGINSCTALCSYYAERGGFIVGFEDL